MPLELRHFQHATTLAEHGSFVRAAAALGLTQPALSRSIQALEAELGVTLFDRQRRGVRPTSYGRILLRHARRVFDQARDMEREIELARGVEAGNLAVGAGPIVAASILPVAVGALCDAYPRIHIRVVIDSWAMLVDALRSSAIDLFCADTRELDDCADLEIQSLPSRQGGFVCRRDHPLAGRKRVALEEILAYPLATFRLPDTVRQSLFGKQLDELMERGPASPGIIRCESIPFVRQLVLSSNALTLLPFVVAEEGIRAGLLRRVDCEVDASTHYGIVRLRGAALSPAADRFIAEVVAADEKLSLGSGQRFAASA